MYLSRLVTVHADQPNKPGCVCSVGRSDRAYLVMWVNKLFNRMNSLPSATMAILLYHMVAANCRLCLFFLLVFGSDLRGCVLTNRESDQVQCFYGLDGYGACLTRRRSPVRVRLEILFAFCAIGRFQL